MSDPAHREALTPPLKWAGGKRWLVPRLNPLWQQHARRRLVEPFCGGLAVTLGLRPQRALLNDINPHLVNFWRWLQTGLESELGPQDNEEALFYQRRDRFNDLIRRGKYETRESALLFYYLNRTGYNGLCRFNSRGYYNVPKGSYRHINYMRTADFLPYRETMRGWDLHCGDFESIELQSDDFVYADPPYDVPFTKYAKEGFDWADQERLVRWLAQHDGPVLLSNQATERIMRLYEACGFTMLVLEAPRRISSNGDRSPAQEVLACRNIALEQPMQDIRQQALPLNLPAVVTLEGLEPSTN